MNLTQPFLASYSLPFPPLHPSHTFAKPRACIVARVVVLRCRTHVPRGAGRAGIRSRQPARRTSLWRRAGVDARQIFIDHSRQARVCTYSWTSLGVSRGWRGSEGRQQHTRETQSRHRPNHANAYSCKKSRARAANLRLRVRRTRTRTVS